MEFEIKGADATNVDKVLSICKGCLAFEDPVFDSDVPTYDTICGGCVSGCSLIACRQGKVLGWAGLTLLEGPGKKNAAKMNVFVDPASRGKGVAKALLGELKSRSKNAGLKSITASVNPKNVPGLMLHKKAGFKAVSVTRNAGKIKGKDSDAVILEYIL